MKQNKFFQFFTSQNKLSMRSVRTGQEIWHIFISRGNFCLSVIVLLLVLFVATLTLVAYTSILDLIPGYPGSRSREMLISSITKLDSLEHEVAMWENYTNDLQLILDGRQPTQNTGDSLKAAAKGSITARNAYDQMLRDQMMLDTASKHEDRRHSELTFEMIPPVRGVVERAFAPATGNFGVLIKPAPASVALAVLDGTVVLNSWNPEWGTVIAIQHAAGMMSVYKGLERSLHQTGARVKAGESVGVVQVARPGYTPTVYFELWNAGNAVDPENYINF